MESIEIAEFIWMVSFFESIMYFLQDLYRTYVWLFFDISVFRGDFNFEGLFYYIFPQTLLNYFGIHFSTIHHSGNLIENWLITKFFWFSELAYISFFFFGNFIYLFTLNILTFFIWRYFWRKREKVKSNKVNFYIIFFQFFPIIWFVWNFIAWKNYEISLWKMLLKNLLFLVVLFLWFVLYAICANLISNGFFMPIYHFFYLIISPILIWLWAYFYYFKIRKSC
jgi:hypothetical protein